MYVKLILNEYILHFQTHSVFFKKIKKQCTITGTILLFYNFVVSMGLISTQIRSLQVKFSQVDSKNHFNGTLYIVFGENGDSQRHLFISNGFPFYLSQLILPPSFPQFSLSF